MLVPFRNSIVHVARKTDWVLLLFLLLFCNQAMLLVKLLGLAVVYLLRPNLRLGLLRGRLPLFYIVAPMLGLVSWAVHIRDAPGTYAFVWGVGSLMWLFCLAATHQIRLSLERYGPATVDATLKVFTCINLVFSLAQVAIIAHRTGELNAYAYHIPFPYGMSTGDHIFGAFGENSYYNMMVSAMLALYFLFRKERLFCFLSVTAVLMVFSNIGTLLLVALLILLAILSLLRKMVIKNGASAGLWRAAPGDLWYPFLLLGYIVAFYVLISPQNFQYTTRAAQESFTTTRRIAADSTRRSIPKQGLRINVSRLNFRKYAPGKSLSAKAEAADRRRRNVLTRRAIAGMEGKKLSVLETAAYLRSDYRALLLGGGVGRFSSLTAHRVSGGDTGRLFSRLPRYNTPLYAQNHGLITRYRLEGGGALLANLNWPESFYNQIFGEYGIVGFVLFLLLYAGHYLRRASRLTYGWWVAALAIPFGVLSYLFEALCPIVFMEVLLEMDTYQAPDSAEA